MITTIVITRFDGGTETWDVHTPDIGRAVTALVDGRVIRDDDLALTVTATR